MNELQFILKKKKIKVNKKYLQLQNRKAIVNLFHVNLESESKQLRKIKTQNVVDEVWLITNS